MFAKSHRYSPAGRPGWRNGELGQLPGIALSLDSVVTQLGDELVRRARAQDKPALAALTEVEFRRLCEFLYRRTGMVFTEAKRYYVEHLLFVLHFHAFFFLILTLEVLFSRATSWLGLPELVRNLSVFVVSVYVPVYLYKAMRRVYEQGRAITLLKYLFLFLTYVIGLSLLLLFAAFYTAFSI